MEPDGRQSVQRRRNLRHADANPDSYADTHPNTYTHSNTYTDSYTDPDTNADSYPNTVVGLLHRMGFY